MNVTSDIGTLTIEIAECDDVLTWNGDNARLALLQTCRADVRNQAPADPVGGAYRDFQIGLQEATCGRP